MAFEPKIVQRAMARLERRRAGYALAIYGFTGYTVALYAVFYPALIGLYTPLWYNSILLRWFPSWPL